MESKNKFLDNMKELQYKNRIKLNKLGYITDIEEVEYQNYKLSII